MINKTAFQKLHLLILCFDIQKFGIKLWMQFYQFALEFCLPYAFCFMKFGASYCICEYSHFAFLRLQARTHSAAKLKHHLFSKMMLTFNRRLLIIAVCFKINSVCTEPPEEAAFWRQIRSRTWLPNLYSWNNILIIIFHLFHLFS